MRSRASVIDDSRQPENQTANAEVVETVAANSSVPLMHFGAEPAGNLINSLKTALPESEGTIDWLSAGSCRNSLTGSREISLCCLV